MAIDPKELDKLIETAGVGKNTARKLRAANVVDGDNKTASGHGAAKPPVVGLTPEM